MKKYLVSILTVFVLFVGVGEVFSDSGETDDGIKTFGQVLQPAFPGVITMNSC